MELSETGLIQLVQAISGNHTTNANDLKTNNLKMLGSIPSKSTKTAGSDVQNEVAAAIQEQLPKALNQAILDAKQSTDSGLKLMPAKKAFEELEKLYGKDAAKSVETAKLGEPVVQPVQPNKADEELTVKLDAKQNEIVDLTNKNDELSATNAKLTQELATVKEQLTLEKDATASANEHTEMLVQQLDEKKQVIVANNKQIKKLQGKIADLEAGNDEQLKQQTDELENYKQKARSLVTFAHNLLKQIDPNAAFIISMPAFNELDAKTRDYLTAAFNTEINDTDANRLVLGGKVDQKEAITNDSLDGLIKTAQSGIDGGSADDTNFNAENVANNDSNQQAGNGFDKTDKKPDEDDPDNY